MTAEVKSVTSFSCYGDKVCFRTRRAVTYYRSFLGTSVCIAESLPEWQNGGNCGKPETLTITFQRYYLNSDGIRGKFHYNRCQSSPDVYYILRLPPSTPVHPAGGKTDSTLSFCPFCLNGWPFHNDTENNRSQFAFFANLMPVFATEIWALSHVEYWGVIPVLGSDGPQQPQYRLKPYFSLYDIQGFRPLRWWERNNVRRGLWHLRFPTAD